MGLVECPRCEGWCVVDCACEHGCADCDYEGELVCPVCDGSGEIDIEEEGQ